MRRPKLITIRFSHFCEKARWSLQRAGLDFKESYHAPGFHLIPAMLAGGRRLTPILVKDDGVLNDSTDILRYADDHGAQLLPTDPVERDVVLGLEDTFDERLGPAVRRCVYFHLFQTPDDYVRDMLALVEAATPGTQAILGRMMELLFVEVLRRHASRMPAGAKGLLAALSDPVVGRALQLIHADPARRWTAENLAHEAGSSRTVLGERFNALLGRPPIDYLVGWRMQLAADRLRHGKDGIARIAADIGYESEAAFSRAFKRVTGVSPGRWRQGAGDSFDLMPLQFNKPVITGPLGT